MSREKKGTARLILTHLRDKGPATTAELAKALKLDARPITASIGTLVVDSKVQTLGTRFDDRIHRHVSVYGLTLLGRESLAKVQPSVVKAAKHAPAIAAPVAPGHTETYEEFIARGGKPEQLSATWSAPTRYPRVGGIS